MSGCIEHYRRMFEYEAWCDGRMLETLERSRVNVEGLGLASLVPPMQRALEIAAHIAAARRVWLSRLDGKCSGPTDGVHPIWPMEKIKSEIEELGRLWGEYVGRLDEKELGREIAYSRVGDQTRCTSRVSDILTHVVNHSTYHRGQIAALVASTGVKPASTDFIVFAREAADV